MMEENQLLLNAFVSILSSSLSHPAQAYRLAERAGKHQFPWRVVPIPTFLEWTSG